MSYLAQYNKVKKILTSIAENDLHKVLVTGGRIYATDDRMTVSAEFPSDLEFFVDAATFGSSLKAKNVSLSMEDDNLVVTSSRGRDVLCCTPPKTFERPGGEWRGIPDTMMEAFRTLAPFQAEDRTHQWACAVTVRDGVTIATNNRILGVWAGGGSDVEAAFPIWLVQYILSLGEKPEGMIIGENSIALKFADGTEILAGRIEKEMPEKAVQAALAVPREGEAITRDWRAAVAYLSELPGCHEIKVTPTSMSTTNQYGTRSREVTSPTTKDSFWDPEWLLRVANVATHINLDNYPAPVTFYGDKVKGLIAGMMK